MSTVPQSPPRNSARPVRPVRAARGIALCLALGLLSTIAAAWVCALAVDVPGDVYGRKGPRTSSRWTRAYLPIDQGPATESQSGADDPRQGPSVFVSAWHNFGSIYVHAETDSGSFGPPIGGVPLDECIPSELQKHAVPWLTGRAPWPVVDADLHVGARGWPFLAFWCRFDTIGQTAGGEPPWVGTPVGGIALQWPAVSHDWYLPPPPLTALPFWPLWRGLALDVAFFAVLWWSVLFGRRALLRSLRRRRGQCAACGYDLRGTPAGTPCPECGQVAAQHGPSCSPGRGQRDAQ